MQKKHWLAFGGTAAAAVAALGGSLYLKQPGALPLAASGAGSSAVEKVPEAPAANPPAAPAPAEQPAATAPAANGNNDAATADAGKAPAAQSPAPQAQVAVADPVAQQPPAAPEPPAATAMPTFDTVRVEPDGNAIIAGQAAPGSEVEALLNGVEVGKAVSNADGSFVIIPSKPLPQGTGALTLQMASKGAVVQSGQSVVIAVQDNAPALVAKVDPAAPTTIMQVPSDQPASDAVQLNVVDYDATGSIVFAGRARPGSAIRFYVDNIHAGDATTDADGRWQFNGASIAAGQHQLRADQLDATGKVINRIELPFVREPEATVAAAQPPASPPAKPPVASGPEAPKPQVVANGMPEIVPDRIVIQPGHNLWRLSRQIYGKGRLYTIIYQANRDQLRDPNRVYPGQILAAPAKSSN